MKTLKILFTALVFTCFFYLPTGAQTTQPVSDSHTIHFVQESFDCIGETVTGFITVEFTARLFVDHKNRMGAISYQSTNTGTLIGDISGAEYNVKERNNMHNMAAIDMTKGYVNATSTGWVAENGRKVARINFRHHLTFVNGEPKSLFEVEKVKCF